MNSEKDMVIFEAVSPSTCDSVVWGSVRWPVLSEDGKRVVHPSATVKFTDCNRIVTWEMDAYGPNYECAGFNLAKIRRAISVLQRLESAMIEGQAEYDRLKATIVDNDDTSSTDREDAAHGT